MFGERARFGPLLPGGSQVIEIPVTRGVVLMSDVDPVKDRFGIPLLDRVIEAQRLPGMRLLPGRIRSPA
jgi:hypothetical protein